MTRKELADLIFVQIDSKKSDLICSYKNSQSKIGYFFIDDLLPIEIANLIYNKFPESNAMVLKKSLREDKYVAAQMNQYDPILEEIIFAFQEPNIVKIIEEICDINSINPDSNLYAGGISMMGKNQFLNPHLDNSHDKDRKQWRVLNLLYYVTPNWEIKYGANLELWSDGLKEEPITIHSKFNRLVVMATHNNSMHSVSPVHYDGFRCCVSNYYFADNALQISDNFHVTSFRGRPANKCIDILLKVDTFIRMTLRKIFINGIRKNPHVYKK